MSKLSSLQIIIIGVCVFLAIVGLLAFAFLGPRPGKSNVIGPTVVVWGTVPQYAMDDTVRTIADENSKKKTADQLPLNILYKEKDPRTFKTDLLQAIASGNGPDVVILPINSIAEEKDIFFSIPFSSYPERTYIDTFIDEANLFKQHDGYFALPFIIDPLVMYYNKTLLTQANIINPPKYWDEVIASIPKLTSLTPDSKINKSAISLGEYRNISNSKEILSGLLLQAGTPITTFEFNPATNADQMLSKIYVAREGSASSLPPSIATLNFYTQFADPTKVTTYTWNRSLPQSQDFFTAGNLAMYLGFASEVNQIEKKNPNLDFDMTFIPQERANTEKSTYGNLFGMAILKSSKNSAGSFQALTSLSSSIFLKTFINDMKLPPVRRDLLSQVPPDAFSPVMYESALKSKGWLDPDHDKTNTIFMSMVENVLSGQALPSEAASRAQLEMQVLTEKIK